MCPTSRENSNLKAAMESNNICDKWAGGLDTASTLRLQCAGLGRSYDYSEVDEINEKIRDKLGC